MRAILILFTIIMSSLLNAQVNAEKEKATVLRMREEEKMARDVYLAMNDKWDHQVFSHISESETYHMSLMKIWVDKFNLDDPVTRNSDKRGVFTDQSLRNLYNELTASGLQSREAAFRAGAKLEEVDILDLKTALAETSNAGLQSTYSYLIHASENHLRAFIRNLGALGRDYKPVVMSQKEFDEIINEQGRGMGNRTGCCMNSGERN